MPGNASFQVFAAGTYTLEQAEGALQNAGLEVVRNADALVVQPARPTEMFVRWSQEPHVHEEARAAGPGLERCHARFEVAVSDLDSALTEYNDLAFVQQVLQELTDGWIVLGWNGAVLPPA